MYIVLAHWNLLLCFNGIKTAELERANTYLLLFCKPFCFLKRRFYTENERYRRFSICCYTLQMAEMARVELMQSWTPGALLGLPPSPGGLGCLLLLSRPIGGELFWRWSGQDTNQYPVWDVDATGWRIGLLWHLAAHNHFCFLIFSNWEWRVSTEV